MDALSAIRILLTILRIREQFAVNRDIHDYLRLFMNIHK